MERRESLLTPGIEFSRPRISPVDEGIINFYSNVVAVNKNPGIKIPGFTY